MKKKFMYILGIIIAGIALLLEILELDFDNLVASLTLNKMLGMLVPILLIIHFLYSIKQLKETK